jgi:hypothetical protein
MDAELAGLEHKLAALLAEYHRLGAENVSVLSRQQRGFTMADAGPRLEYNFLFFNLNDLG